MFIEKYHFLFLRHFLLPLRHFVIILSLSLSLSLGSLSLFFSLILSLSFSLSLRVSPFLPLEFFMSVSLYLLVAALSLFSNNLSIFYYIHTYICVSVCLSPFSRTNKLLPSYTWLFRALNNILSSELVGFKIHKFYTNCFFLSQKIFIFLLNFFPY